MLSIHESLFHVFSILSIACAFIVVTTPNPIHSVLFLVGAFSSAGSLLVLFGAEYLGITLKQFWEQVHSSTNKKLFSIKKVERLKSFLK